MNPLWPRWPGWKKNDPGQWYHWGWLGRRVHRLCTTVWDLSRVVHDKLTSNEARVPRPCSPKLRGVCKVRLFARASQTIWAEKWLEHTATKIIWIYLDDVWWCFILPNLSAYPFNMIIYNTERCDGRTLDRSRYRPLEPMLEPMCVMCNHLRETEMTDVWYWNIYILLLYWTNRSPVFFGKHTNIY